MSPVFYSLSQAQFRYFHSETSVHSYPWFISRNAETQARTWSCVIQSGFSVGSVILIKCFHCLTTNCMLKIYTRHNPGTQKTETRGLQVLDQPGLNSEAEFLRRQ